MPFSKLFTSESRPGSELVHLCPSAYMQNMLTFFHFTFINIDIPLLPQVRLNALNTLYQFPLSDELSSKNSDGIRKGLLAALADEDQQLAVCSNLCFKDKILDFFSLL